MRVTVVIPVWGPYRRSLGEAIASVRSTSRAEVQVVVVDNAASPPITGKDWEAERATSAGGGTRADDPPVTVLRLEGRVPLGAARNSGLDVVETEWVVFLDADDMMAPGGLDALAAAASRDRDAVAVSGRLVTPGGAAYGWPTRGMERVARMPWAFRRLTLVRPCFSVNGALIRTEVARDAGGYDEDEEGAEDWPFGVALAWRGSVTMIAEATVVYASRPQGLWAQSQHWRAQVAHRGAVRARARWDERIRIGVGVPVLVGVHLGAVVVGALRRRNR